MSSMWIALLVVANAGAAVPKLGAPGLNAVNIDPKVATFFSDHLAHELTARGFKVITASEINLMVGMERQKQILGCASDGSSCSVEMANALGVDALLAGTVARLDRLIQIDVKVIAARDGHTLTLFSGRADSEAGALAVLETAAERIAQSLGARTSGTPTVASSPRRMWWLPATGGAALLVAGGYFTFDAVSKYRALTSPSSSAYPSSLAAEQQLVSDGKRSTLLGAIGVSSGVALGLAAGVVALGWTDRWFAVTPTSSGAVFAVGGPFP